MIVCNLGRLMWEKKLTIGKLASLAGLHYMTVKNLFEDNLRRVDMDTLNKLCKALECKPGDIFDYTPD
ncbi:MAG: hypothetical protein A4E53_03394 [Pelotomaculum sp. PtaB.Bin104]|nr:MAG: hypothetical protein A4E53_03394 [Pelotomaculum sp. PtaB.Bin104]